MQWRHIGAKHIKKAKVYYKIQKKILEKVSKAYRKAFKEMVHKITINNGKVNQLSRAIRT